MSGHAICQDLFDAYDSEDAVVRLTGGGAIRHNGESHKVFILGAGTYKLDNAPPGVRALLIATGAVTIQNQDASAVATMTSGQTREFYAKTATAWGPDAGDLSAMIASGLAVNSFTNTGFIDLPLTSWREVTSNDITNAAGNGGVLATDTTPALEYVNGDTDSQIRLLWAATNQDAITRQLTLPPDCDTTQPLVLHITAVSGGLNDSPVIDFDTFFNQGDTKVSDATEAIQDNVAGVTATIAAADIPANGGTVAGESGLPTMSIELTPGAHGSDTLAILATWLTYSKKFTGE